MSVKAHPFSRDTDTDTDTDTDARTHTHTHTHTHTYTPSQAVRSKWQGSVRERLRAAFLPTAALHSINYVLQTINFHFIYYVS